MNPQEISDDYLNSFMFFWSFNGDGGNRVFATRGRQIAWFTYFDFKYLKNYAGQEAAIYKICSVFRADSEKLYISLIGS